MTAALYMASAVLATCAIVAIVWTITTWAHRKVRRAYHDAGVPYNWANEDDGPRVTPDRPRCRRSTYDYRNGCRQ